MNDNIKLSADAVRAEFDRRDARLKRLQDHATGTLREIIAERQQLMVGSEDHSVPALLTRGQLNYVVACVVDELVPDAPADAPERQRETQRGRQRRIEQALYKAFRTAETQLPSGPGATASPLVEA